MKAVFKKLLTMDDYVPLLLSNEEMAIDKYGESTGQMLLLHETHRRYRYQFCKELEKVADRICFNVFCKLHDGTKPDSLLVWKVPAVTGPRHIGYAQRAITQTQEMIPKAMTVQAVKQFNCMIDGVTGLNAKAREALRNYLFQGDPDPDKTLGDGYVQLVLGLSAGQPIDQSLLVSRFTRDSNSRGGHGAGAT